MCTVPAALAKYLSLKTLSFAGKTAEVHLKCVPHLSQVADLLVSHFHKNLNDEVDCLGRVAVDLSDGSNSQMKCERHLDIYRIFHHKRIHTD